MATSVLNKDEILRISGLNKNFYLHKPQLEIKSCQDINISLRQGEFIGIIGRSGAGKSTILKCINRSYLPLSGDILYDSAAFGPIDLARASEREIVWLRNNEIGYVSQFLNVMPRTTALDHVMNALIEGGSDRETAEKSAREMLAYFKLREDLWNLYPVTFSGGEQLRLNLAHAMVKKPRLLMLDEPTASLDAKTKELVRDMLARLKSKNTSMIGIFHDIEFMQGVCDRVFDISEGSFIST